VRTGFVCAIAAPEQTRNTAKANIKNNAIIRLLLLNVFIFPPYKVVPEAQGSLYKQLTHSTRMLRIKVSKLCHSPWEQSTKNAIKKCYNLFAICYREKAAKRKKG